MLIVTYGSFAGWAFLEARVAWCKTNLFGLKPFCGGWEHIWQRRLSCSLINVGPFSGGNHTALTSEDAQHNLMYRVLVESYLNRPFSIVMEKDYLYFCDFYKEK